MLIGGEYLLYHNYKFIILSGSARVSWHAIKSMQPPLSQCRAWAITRIIMVVQAASNCLNFALVSEIDGRQELRGQRETQSVSTRRVAADSGRQDGSGGRRNAGPPRGSNSLNPARVAQLDGRCPLCRLGGRGDSLGAGAITKHISCHSADEPIAVWIHTIVHAISVGTML